MKLCECASRSYSQWLSYRVAVTNTLAYSHTDTKKMLSFGIAKNVNNNYLAYWSNMYRLQKMLYHFGIVTNVNFYRLWQTLELIGQTCTGTNKMLHHLANKKMLSFMGCDKFSSQLVKHIHTPKTVVSFGKQKILSVMGCDKSLVNWLNTYIHQKLLYH